MGVRNVGAWPSGWCDGRFPKILAQGLGCEVRWCHTDSLHQPIIPFAQSSMWRQRPHEPKLHQPGACFRGGSSKRGYVMVESSLSGSYAKSLSYQRGFFGSRRKGLAVAPARICSCYSLCSVKPFVMGSTAASMSTATQPYLVPVRTGLHRSFPM